MYVPRVMITDQLKSNGAAKREILPSVVPRQHRSLNNRAETSHKSTRQRERCLQGLKSPGHAPRFLAGYGPIAQYIRPRRHLFHYTMVGGSKAVIGGGWPWKRSISTSSTTRA